MTKYIELHKNPANYTHLKVEVYYSLGGMNYFTSKIEPRGYYISVTPVERSFTNGVATETVTAFTGIKECIKPVSRKSKKAEIEANNMASNKIDALIEYVCNRQNLKVFETVS